MAKIYWRKGGRTSDRHFQGAWAWGRKTIKGREYREPLGTQSPKEAREYFERWQEGVARSASKWAKDETPFPKAVEQFTTHHMPTLKRSSEERYLVSLLNLTPHFEGKTLQGIGKADLAEFVSARRQQKVTDSTIRRDLACLSSVFTIAQDFELCEDNPVLGFLRVQKRRKRLIDAPSRERYLSHEEEALVLELARRRYDTARGRLKRTESTRLMILAAIALAIDTGLRHEELLRLEWKDVDLERSQVTITAERSKSKRQRLVPLLPRAQRILAGLPRHPTTPLVIWHRNGVGFAELNHTLQRLCREVGASGLRWHDLRRTCGCRLLQDHKMPIEQVSQWLGHASVTQTQRAYAFIKIDNLHESVGTRRAVDAELQRRLSTVLTIEN